MRPLTDRQAEVLECIVAYFARHGFWPSYRDLCEELEIGGPTGVVYHLKVLVRKGYLSACDQSRAFVVKDLSDRLRREAANWLANNLHSPHHLPRREVKNGKADAQVTARRNRDRGPNRVREE